MSSALANPKGLEDLLSRGYSLSFPVGQLVVNDVWYLNSSGDLAKGRLAAPLTRTDNDTVGTPANHQIYWSGSAPYDSDCMPIPLGAIVIDLKVDDTDYHWHLSNKPDEGFSLYTELVEHYVTLISGPAEQKFGVTSRTGAIYDTCIDDSPFKVHDTFSSRAEITDLNKLLMNDRIAIIGLGGTGAYVLDFMAKTPVHSIEAYDFDVFEVHNGFRSPGKVSVELFGNPKADIYQQNYKDFRHRLHCHRKRVAAGDEALFSETTFAFVCIDDGEAREEICLMFKTLKIPFIDVGMGIEKENGHLDGLIRTTLFTQQTFDRAFADVPLDKPGEEGAYRVFVQIAELNALNAALAVMQYKQTRKFYSDDASFYNNILSIGSSKLFGTT